MNAITHSTRINPGLKKVLVEHSPKLDIWIKSAQYTLVPICCAYEDPNTLEAPSQALPSNSSASVYCPGVILMSVEPDPERGREKETIVDIALRAPEILNRLLEPP
jgi:hypothetical protein